MIRSLFTALMGLVLGTLLLAQPAVASTFTLMTGNNSTNAQSMTIDSNQCGTAGPRAAYVGGTITAGASAETNVSATISGVSGNFFLGGNPTVQPATQTIGALAANQTIGVYWFIGYNCTANSSTTVTININSSAGTVTRNVTLTTKSSISANAGGQVTSWTLGNGAVVGQTIYFDARYDFGGSSASDEFIFQPSGGLNFDAGCFRLVRSEILASNITPVVAGTLYKMYFVQTGSQPGNGYYANVRYYFEYQCAGAATTARPYAMQTSGTQLKYTGNFDGTGSVTISFPSATYSFTTTKTEDKSFTLAGTSTTVKYTVTIANTGNYASRVANITDVLPSGATFAGFDSSSDITASNSASVPAINAPGTLTFWGKPDVSYVLPANSSIKLVYNVTMPSSAGSYTNSAQSTIGGITSSTASVTFTVYTPVPITVVKASQAFSDPVNGTTNPKLIPGGYVHYTITVANPAAYPIDADSVIITDPTPANLSMFVSNLPSNSAPVLFQNGSPSSALTFTFLGLADDSDDVDFSSDGGTTWNYHPVADGSGFNAAITNIRIRPKGTMAANSSFALTVRYKVN